MRARALLALFLPFFLAGPVLAALSRNEAAIDSLLVSLELERKARSEDVDDLERVGGRIGRAEANASAARSHLVQILRDRESDATAVENAEEGVAETEARVRALEDRRRALSARLVERIRRIASLSDEIARRRAAGRGAGSVDPVSGRWEVVVNPGGRRGIYRLSLDGTLVSGEYSLDGGFRGSLRGTYVGEKLTLQRVDSERGIDANFYGRLIPAQRRVVGTWEATAVAPAVGPVAGTWGGTLLADRDEPESERP